MLTTVWAIVKNGKIEPIESISLEEDTRVIVTLVPDEHDREFWLHASESALAGVWDNEKDDTYANLLQKS